LEVRDVDRVVVQEVEVEVHRPPGAREHLRHGAAEASEAEHQHARRAGGHAKYSARLKYRSPVSQRTVSTRLPGPSSRARSSATATLAPELMPTRSPSRRARPSFTSQARSSLTARTSSTTSGS